MLFKAICSVLISSILVVWPFLAFGQITQIPQSTSGGGGGSSGKYAATLSSSTTWTVTGATHALGSADLGIFVSYDDGTSYVSMEPDICSVHKSTYDVTCTFTSAQAGRILIVGGASGGGGGGGNHASTHQHGGADEVSTATPGANAIPKAGAGGTLATGWLPTGTVGVLSTVVNNIDLGSLTNCEGSDRTTTVAGAVVGNFAVVVPPITNDVRMSFPAFVTSPNTVTWRACGLAGTGVDQPNGNYTVKVYYELN